MEEEEDAAARRRTGAKWLGRETPRTTYYFTTKMFDALFEAWVGASNRTFLLLNHLREYIVVKCKEICASIW